MAAIGDFGERSECVWKGEEKKQNVTEIVSEKRKSEMVIVTEDKIEKMLTEEKMLKLGTEKFSILKKLV